jgi:hypothetical protein
MIAELLTGFKALLPDIDLRLNADESDELNPDGTVIMTITQETPVQIGVPDSRFQLVFSGQTLGTEDRDGAKINALYESVLAGLKALDATDIATASGEPAALFYVESSTPPSMTQDAKFFQITTVIFIRGE